MEEVFDYFGVEIVYVLVGKFGFIFQVWVIRDIQCAVGKVFVYWQYKIKAVNIVFVFEGDFQCFVQRQVGIFDGVVIVDIEVVFDVDFYVEIVVGSDLIQYMIKEVNVGVNFAVIFMIQLYLNVNLCFFGIMYYVSVMVMFGELFVNYWLVQGFVVVV